MNLKKKMIVIISIIAICICSFSILVVSYRKRLEASFDILASKNLESFNKTQKVELETHIHEANNTMSAIALGSYDNEKEIQNKIKQMSALSLDYNIDYLSLGKLQKMTNDQEFKDIKDLKLNQFYIHKYYKQDQNSNYIIMMMPVEVNHKLDGIIYSLLDNSIFLSTSQTGFLKDDIEWYLIDNSGNTISSLSVNAVENLKNVAKDPQEINKILDAIKAGKTGGQMLILDNEKYYASYMPLSYNNWYLFSVSDSQELTTFSSKIFYELSFLTGFILTIIGLTMIALLYLVYRDQRKKNINEKRFQLLAKFSDVVVAEYDIKKDILRFTSNAQKMLSLKKLVFENFKETLHHSDLIYPDDVQTVSEVFQKMSEGLIENSYEVRMKFADGVYNWCKIDYSLLFADGHKPIGIVYKITDNSKEHARVEELQEKSRRDDLTGLYQKNSFIELVKHLLDQKQFGTLMILDLDDFKNINDKYGHTVGDQCLLAFSDVLKKQFRENDIIGRYGGDEFEIYMRGLIDMSHLQQKLEDLMYQLDQVEIENIHLKCSIGAVIVKEDRLYEDIFNQADEALYEAKKKGKNSFVIKE